MGPSVESEPPSTYKLVLLQGRKEEGGEEVEKFMGLAHSWSLLGVVFMIRKHFSWLAMAGVHGAEQPKI